MRFSLKWLLVGVAYVAVVCASLASPSDLWLHVISGLGLLLFTLAAIVSACGTGRLRAFAIGFAITWLIVRAATFADWKVNRDLRSTAVQVTGGVAKLLPNHDERVRRVIAKLHTPHMELGRIADISRHSHDELALTVELTGGTSSAPTNAVFFVPLAAYEAIPTDYEVTELILQHLLTQLALLGGCVGLWASRSKAMPLGPTRP